MSLLHKIVVLHITGKDKKKSNYHIFGQNDFYTTFNIKISQIINTLYVYDFLKLIYLLSYIITHFLRLPVLNKYRRSRKGCMIAIQTLYKTNILDIQGVTKRYL